MGEYFCDTCKFYDDDVSKYWAIIYWDDWQFDELILGLLRFNCVVLIFCRQANSISIAMDVGFVG